MEGGEKIVLLPSRLYRQRGCFCLRGLPTRGAWPTMERMTRPKLDTMRNGWMHWGSLMWSSERWGVIMKTVVRYLMGLLSVVLIGRTRTDPVERNSRETDGSSVKLSNTQNCLERWWAPHPWKHVSQKWRVTWARSCKRDLSPHAEYADWTIALPVYVQTVRTLLTLPCSWHVSKVRPCRGWSSQGKGRQATVRWRQEEEPSPQRLRVHPCVPGSSRGGLWAPCKRRTSWMTATPGLCWCTWAPAACSPWRPAAHTPSAPCPETPATYATSWTMAPSTSSAWVREALLSLSAPRDRATCPFPWELGSLQGSAELAEGSLPCQGPYPGAWWGF